MSKTILWEMKCKTVGCENIFTAERLSKLNTNQLKQECFKCGETHFYNKDGIYPAVWEADSANKIDFIKSNPAKEQIGYLTTNKKPEVLTEDQDVYEYGIQSNIPPCCCKYFIEVWSKHPRSVGVKRHTLFLQEKYNAWNPNKSPFQYIPCPKCAEKGTFNKLVLGPYIRKASIETFEEGC